MYQEWESVVTHIGILVNNFGRLVNTMEKLQLALDKLLQARDCERMDTDTGDEESTPDSLSSAEDIPRYACRSFSANVFFTMFLTDCCQGG